MWISKKKWEAVEKRIADLEERVQGQPKEIIDIIVNHMQKQETKAVRPHRRELKSQFDGEA